MSSEITKASDHLYKACDILNDLLADDTPYTDELFDVMDLLATCVAKLTTLQTTTTDCPNNQGNETNEKGHSQNQNETVTTDLHDDGLMFGITQMNFLHDTSTRKSCHDDAQQNVRLGDESQGLSPSDLVSCGSSFHSIHHHRECESCEQDDETKSIDSNASQVSYIDSFYEGMSVHSFHLEDALDEERDETIKHESISKLNSDMNKLTLTPSHHDDDDDDEVIIRRPTNTKPLPTKNIHASKLSPVHENSSDDDSEDEGFGEQAEIGVSSDDDSNNRDSSSEGDDIDTDDDEDCEGDWDDGSDDSFVGTTSDEESNNSDESEEVIIPKRSNRKLTDKTTKGTTKSDNSEKSKATTEIPPHGIKSNVAKTTTNPDEKIRFSKDVEDSSDYDQDSIDSDSIMISPKKPKQNKSNPALQPTSASSKSFITSQPQTPVRNKSNINTRPSTSIKPTTSTSRFLTPVVSSKPHTSLVTNPNRLNNGPSQSFKFALDPSSASDDDLLILPRPSATTTNIKGDNNGGVGGKSNKKTKVGQIPQHVIEIDSDSDDSIVISRPSGPTSLSKRGKSTVKDSKEQKKVQTKSEKSRPIIEDPEDESPYQNNNEYHSSEELSDPDCEIYTPNQNQNQTRFTTPSKTASKNAQRLIPDLSGKEFVSSREEFAQLIYKDANKKVFGGKLPENLDIRWSKTLLKTAGRFNYKKSSTTKEYKDLNIELSIKVLDSSERLQTTLLHEICHLAALYIDNVSNPPHGKTFYKYAQMIGKAYPYVTITTYHSYEIHYKFQYCCTGCGKEFGRHSKVKEIEKICCRYCNSPFEFSGSFNPDGTPVKQRQTSQYTRFQQQYGKEIALNWNKINSKQTKGDESKNKNQLLSAVAQEYKMYLQDPEAYFPGISFIM